MSCGIDSGRDAFFRLSNLLFYLSYLASQRGCLVPRACVGRSGARNFFFYGAHGPTGWNTFPSLQERLECLMTCDKGGHSTPRLHVTCSSSPPVPALVCGGSVYAAPLEEQLIFSRRRPHRPALACSCTRFDEASLTFWMEKICVHP